jgi:hypothetical protein
VTEKAVSYSPSRRTDEPPVVVNSGEAARLAGHTPGPWRIRNDHAQPFPVKPTEVGGTDGFTALNLDLCAGEKTVAEAVMWTAQAGHPRVDNEAECRANARLIAAAPDLLAAADEALNVLIGCCVSAGGCDDPQHIADAKAQLRAALAKVRP